MNNWMTINEAPSVQQQVLEILRAAKPIAESVQIDGDTIHRMPLDFVLDTAMDSVGANMEARNAAYQFAIRCTGRAESGLRGADAVRSFMLSVIFNATCKVDSGLDRYTAEITRYYNE